MKSLSASLKSTGPLLVPAVLLLLAAVWFGWSGWQAAQADRLVGTAASARAAVATEIGDTIAEATARLEATRVRIALGTALQRDDLESARELVTKGWEGVEALEWHEAGLDAAYADPKAFGFGKIGLLEDALQHNAAEAAVIHDGGGPKLGVAAPVIADGRVVKLVYVRLPIDLVTAPVREVSLPAGYIALRQGQHNVVASGDEALAGSAEHGAAKVPGSRLRVVATAPMPAGALGATGNYGVAGLCVLAAIGLLLAPRLRARRAAPVAADGVGEADMTLAELQRSGKLVREPVPQVALAPAVPAEAPRAVLDRSIFRAYDIPASSARRSTPTRRD